MNQLGTYYVPMPGAYRMLGYTHHQPVYFVYPSQTLLVMPQPPELLTVRHNQAQISRMKQESRPIAQIKSQVEEILKSQLRSQKEGDSVEKHTRPRQIGRQIKRKYQKGQVRPERSALTNIGNQLLTYLYIQKKNCRIIRRMFPQLTEQELANYYDYARRLKQCMYGYFNQQKLKKLWQQNTQGEQQQLNSTIVRKLTFYYMRQLLILAIMTSKKMPGEVKPLHLTIRRDILKLMRSTFHPSQLQ